MAARTKLDMDPANSTAVVYGDDQTGASFTLAANSVGDGLARTLSILNNSATDHTGKTLAVVGTDADGKAQTETITGPNSSTTTVGSKHFLTVTSITPSATIGADTFDLGVTDVCVSKTIPLDSWSDLGATVAIDVTGTIAFDVEVTYDSVNDPSFTWTDQSSPAWLNATNLTNKTADIIAVLDQGAQACRVIINSYTDTAELQAWVTQTQSR